jgi:hypothetical protein
VVADEDEPPEEPRIQIDTAARRAFEAIDLVGVEVAVD